MAKMKLDPVYPDIVNRFQYVKRLTQTLGRNMLRASLQSMNITTC